MITQIEKIQNIGVYDSCDASAIELKKLSIFFARNGRGKSTLSAIFRSNVREEPYIVVERHRFGSTGKPFVKLVVDSTENVVFHDGAWTSSIDGLHVFDDDFIESNVYSGLDVTPEHREALHQIVLGKSAVRLQLTVNELAGKISDVNRKIRELELRVSEKDRSGLSWEKFAELPEVAEPEATILALESERKRISEFEDLIAKERLPRPLMPKLDTVSIQKALKLGLNGLEQRALEKVVAHLSSLGKGGEEWISRGLSFVTEKNRSECPFCQSSLEGVETIKLYQTYFSEEYDELVSTVNGQIEKVKLSFSDDKIAQYTTDVAKLPSLLSFWQERVGSIKNFEYSLEEPLRSISQSKAEVLDLLEQKRKSPLDTIDISPTSKALLAEYAIHCEACDSIGDQIDRHNLEIEAALVVPQTGRLRQIESQLCDARAWQHKANGDTVQKWCQDWLNLRKEKLTLEREKDFAKASLEEQQAKLFPKFGERINAYLKRFGCTYGIAAFKKNNVGGKARCDYILQLRDGQVRVGSGKPAKGESHFGNTLSAGDRRSLALAFFASSIEDTEDIGNITLVVDDPMTSLDMDRRHKTLDLVSEWTSKGAQVLILTHSKEFASELCQLTDIPSKGDVPLLVKIKFKNHGSVMEVADADQEFKTDLRTWVESLEHALHSDPEDISKVASQVRLALERGLSELYPGLLNGARGFEDMVQRFSRAAADGQEWLTIDQMEALVGLKDFAWRSHHTGSTVAFGTDTLDAGELRTFCELALKVLRGRAEATQAVVP